MDRVAIPIKKTNMMSHIISTLCSWTPAIKAKFFNSCFVETYTIWPVTCTKHRAHSSPSMYLVAVDQVRTRIGLG